MKNPIQMIKQCVEKEEPYFVLRGQDVCALAAIETYYEEEGERSLFHRGDRRDHERFPGVPGGSV